MLPTIVCEGPCLRSVAPGAVIPILALNRSRPVASGAISGAVVIHALCHLNRLADLLVGSALPFLVGFAVLLGRVPEGTRDQAP